MKEVADGPKEEEVYKDALDAGEVFLQRDMRPQPQPPMENLVPH